MTSTSASMNVLSGKSSYRTGLTCRNAARGKSESRARDGRRNGRHTHMQLTCTLTLDSTPNRTKSPFLSVTGVPASSEHYLLDSAILTRFRNTDKAGIPAESSCVPLIKVPLELSRSRRVQAFPLHRNSACFSDTAGSLTWTLLALVLPTLSTCPALARFCPSQGPATAWSRSWSGSLGTSSRSCSPAVRRAAY